MVVAASRGLLQPIPDRRDRRATLRERWILEQLYREVQLREAELRLMRESASIQIPAWDTEASVYNHHRETSRKEYMYALQHLEPWVDWDKQIAEAEERDRLKDVKLWEDQYGQLSDPEVQNEIDRLAEFLESGRPLSEETVAD